MSPRKPHRRASGGSAAPQDGTAQRPERTAGSESAAGSRTAGSGAAAEPAVLRARAADDDPRVWGDSPEDRDSWLLEQRPPHWD